MHTQLSLVFVCITYSMRLSSPMLVKLQCTALFNDPLFSPKVNIALTFKCYKDGQQCDLPVTTKIYNRMKAELHGMRISTSICERDGDEWLTVASSI